jgi:hypothetical protein
VIISLKGTDKWGIGLYYFLSLTGDNSDATSKKDK